MPYQNRYAVNQLYLYSGWYGRNTNIFQGTAMGTAMVSIYY